MRAIVITALVALVGFVVGSIDGSLVESTAGLGVAASIAVVCVALGLTPLVGTASRRGATAFVMGLGALALAVALLPVVETLAPGEPAAAADLHEVGEALALPAGLDGRVRVLVHAKLPPAPARLAVRLAARGQKLAAELETTRATVRLGRRGRGTTVQSHESKFIDARLHGDRKLTLASASGAWPVPLHVEIFREWLPDWAFIAGAVLLLCLAALLGASTGLGSRVAAGVGCALFFGGSLHYMATPDVALRPEVGALIIALFATTLSAPTLTLLGERMLGESAGRD